MREDRIVFRKAQGPFPNGFDPAKWKPSAVPV
jgi:hypothetical protein